MQNERRETPLLSIAVGAAAGMIAALLLMPRAMGKGARPAPGAGGGELPELSTSDEARAEIPGNWKAYFSSLLERIIMAVRAGREEMRRTREELTEKGKR